MADQGENNSGSSDLSSLSSDSWSDDDELFAIVLGGSLRRSRLEPVPRGNPMALEEDDFKVRFRLCKETLLRLCDRLTPHLSAGRRTNAETTLEKLLVTLRFFATASFQITMGDFIGLHTSTVCRIVHETSQAIASLAPEEIFMPRPEELDSVVQGFYNMSCFPRVIGALDCTHIRVQSMGGPNAELYRNRKLYFSLNVQVICDSEMRIRNFVARHYGSTHDQTVFDASVVRVQMERGHFLNGVLLGDAGYGCTRYLLTPFMPASTPEQLLYNEAHSRTRNVIERFFGVWKRRFPVLSMGMCFRVERVQAVTAACTVLHNIAVTDREELPPLPDNVEDEVYRDLNQCHGMQGPALTGGNFATRNTVLEYFRSLLEDGE